MFHNINLRICEILLSLPSRERGLKYCLAELCVCLVEVAPFAGAWIEIVNASRSSFHDSSLPSRERGLKSAMPGAFVAGLFVAPFAGAWIEIGVYLGRGAAFYVAPFAGAWIEISKMLEISWSRACRSLRGSVD